MKKIIKRSVAVMLIISMAAMLCVGCGKKEEETQDVVEFSWYVNFSWYTGEWGNNLVSQEITKQTGCSVDFVTPTGDANEKLDSMIAADTLPDLITLGWWEPEIDEMINNGDVYALDELADEYEPYFYDVVNDEVVRWHTKEDGHIYGYPNSAYSPSDYEKYDNLASNETFLVRKDIYEAIGSPDMTTPEGFAAAVRKAAKMFPTVDGKELIPVGSTEFHDLGSDSFDNYLLDFLAVSYVDEKGNAADRHKSEDLKIWLKTFNQLAREGLLKDDIFVDTRTQMAEKIEEGRYFCMIYQYTDLADQQKTLLAKNPDSVYIAVDGPKNMAGDDYTLQGSSVNGWTITMVSKNCKNPEKAIKLMTYLISEEGQKTTWLGVEGKTWDYNSEGVPEMHEDVKELLNSDRIAFDEKYGADSCYWMFQNEVVGAQWCKDDPADPSTQQKQWTYPYTTYVGQYTITLDTETPIGKIKHNAELLWGETLPKLLLAKSEEEFDQIYNELMDKRYNELGYGKVLNELTKIIKQNIEKLGLNE